MKQYLLTLLTIFSCVNLHAQVADNFADENFNQNPTWVGDDSLFVVTTNQLKLKGTISSDAYLATAHSLLDSVTWSFQTRFALSPSTQNFSRFYLVSSTANLKGALNGYYVQLGGVTGNTDSITLYKQSGTTHTRLIAGRSATVSKSNNLVRVQVFRDHLGNWQLWSDTTGGKNFISEGTAFDNTFTSGNYLGWFIRYSAGNSQNHYLDDVFANIPIQDSVAPTLDSISYASNNSVMAYFNEPLDTTTALDQNNYLLSPQTINPAQISFIDAQTVRLTFGTPFLPKQIHTLAVTDITDVNANIITPTQKTFLYDVFVPEDVLISEFFADPSPTNGLPELEFIELYNNNNTPLNLTGFTVSDGSTTATLPNYTLAPDSFVIVCATTSVSAFAGYGNVLGIAGFPSLNNAGDVITVKDKTNQTIHSLTYDLSWYNNDARTDGGFTIELLNPKQLCKGKFNYGASDANVGGTPGTYNSRWSTTLDTVAPTPIQYTILDSVTVRLVFNEPLINTQASLAQLTAKPTVIVNQITLMSTDTLLITLQQPLTNQTTYSFTLKNIADCTGNEDSILFSSRYVLPQIARNFDVLINEIMADPDPSNGLPSVEYVELFNRSTKPISLKNWTLADVTTKAKLPDYLLLPDSFVIITSSAYTVLFNQSSIGVNSFPSLGNDGDNLTLTNDGGQMIHAVNYTSAWITDALKRDGGYSLEMVDTKNPCGSGNWKASTHPFGGTPGNKNSVAGKNLDETPPRLTRIYAMDSIHLELFFNEAMDSTRLINNAQYAITPHKNILSVAGRAPFYSSTVLTLAQPIGLDTTYTLSVSNANDCASNQLQDYSSLEFGLPYQPESTDLAINEVLFNPSSAGVDFVEIYNKSNKLIDLKNCIIAKRDDAGNISSYAWISPSGFMLKPQGYLVATSSTQNIQQTYFCLNPENLVTVNLPGLNDDAGNIILLDNKGRIFDELNYTNKMHVPLLDDENGVSIERIDFNRPTSDATNWTSAAASVGYATPTYKNSQYLQTQHADYTIQLQPKTISPDGDGYQDVMNINYVLNQTGYTGTLTIFNDAGVVVKTLFKNNILGTSGTYTWDGTLTDGGKAPIGIYIFYLEVFNLTGDTKSYKTAGVVAGKL